MGADKGWQNMKVIPLNQISSITIKDSDYSFKTTNKPKAVGFAACTALGLGFMGRQSVSGQKKFVVDTMTSLGFAAGLYGGFKFGCWFFKDHRFVDGSFVELHTPGGISGFTCQ